MNEHTNGFIYLIKNLINNKCYVGKTKRNIKIRWYEHVRRSKSCNENDFLHFDMRKLGIENFSIEVIDEDNIENLSNKEKFWILRLKSNIHRYPECNGYNLTDGGNGGQTHMLQEIRDRIRASLMGHITLQETKDKISETLNGRKLTKEHRVNIGVGLKNSDKFKQACQNKAPISQETKDKIGINSLEMWQDEQFHKKMSLLHRGSNNSRAKMNEIDVIEIKTLWNLERPDLKTKYYHDRTIGEFYTRFAIKFNVSANMICRIIKNRAWKHIDPQIENNMKG